MNNKNIGILTFPHSPSFGASLQMTALYSVLKQNGYNVDIINYMNRFMKDKKHISETKGNKIKKMISKSLTLSTSLRFKKFERSLSYYPSRVIHDNQKLMNVEKHFDKIICGSDQVWNPNITGDDLSYFLNFCEGEKRIAYAPSFGVTELSEPIRTKIAYELKQFSGLSVREQQGQKLAYDLTGLFFQVVIDPTMLLDENFWNTKIKKPLGLKFDQHYIVNFTFHPNDTTKKFINSLEQKSGIKSLRYTWSAKEILKNNNCVGQFGPQEWLWYIKNADYVVTDSFHGCVFSILFKKKFFVSMNATANSRLKNLLSEFSLEDRIIEISNEALDLTKEIDYTRVEAIRKQRANESLEYLINSLEKEA